MNLTISQKTHTQLGSYSVGGLVYQ